MSEQISSVGLYRTTEKLREYNKLKMRRWRVANREHWLAYMREHKKAARAADPDRFRAEDRARYVRDGEKIKDRNAIYRARRTAAVAALKDRPCADCGGRFHFASMHFDHLPERGPKRADVSLIRAKHPIAEAIAEIAKCEVVCANCHAVRTFNRQPRRMR